MEEVSRGSSALATSQGGGAAHPSLSPPSSAAGRVPDLLSGLVKDGEWLPERTGKFLLLLCHGDPPTVSGATLDIHNTWV